MASWLYPAADSSVEDQYPRHSRPSARPDYALAWFSSFDKLNSFLHNGIIPGVESGIASKGGGGSDKGKVSLTPYRWEAHGYAAQSARDEKGTGHTMIVIPEGHIGLMIGVRGSLLEHPDYTTRIGELYADGAPRSTGIHRSVRIQLETRYVRPAWVRVDRPKEHLLKKVKVWTIGPLV